VGGVVTDSISHVEAALALLEEADARIQLAKHHLITAKREERVRASILKV